MIGNDGMQQADPQKTLPEKIEELFDKIILFIARDDTYGFVHEMDCFVTDQDIVAKFERTFEWLTSETGNAHDEASARNILSNDLELSRKIRSALSHAGLASNIVVDEDNHEVLGVNFFAFLPDHPDTLVKLENAYEGAVVEKLIESFQMVARTVQEPMKEKAVRAAIYKMLPYLRDAGDRYEIGG